MSSRVPYFMKECAGLMRGVDEQFRTHERLGLLVALFEVTANRLEDSASYVSDLESRLEKAAERLELRDATVALLDIDLSALRARLEKAEAELRGIFASDGNEEARWIEDMKHACPHCGGSGHKDDVRALKSPTSDQGDEA